MLASWILFLGTLWRGAQTPQMPKNWTLQHSSLKQCENKAVPNTRELSDIKLHLGRLSCFTAGLRCVSANTDFKWLCLLRLEAYTDTGMPVIFQLRNKVKLDFWCSSYWFCMEWNNMKSQCRTTIVLPAFFIIIIIKILKCVVCRSIHVIKNRASGDCEQSSGWCPWPKADSPVRNGLYSYISVPVNLQW